MSLESVMLHDAHTLESESEVTQSCPTLCDAWTVAHLAPPSMKFSRQEYQSGLPFPSLGTYSYVGLNSLSFSVCVHAVTHVQLFMTPWTVAHQAPLSMEFSRQEYWSGSPFSTPGDPPDPGIKPTSIVSPALAARFFTTEPPGKPLSFLSPLVNKKGDC